LPFSGGQNRLMFLSILDEIVLQEVIKVFFGGSPKIFSALTDQWFCNYDRFKQPKRGIFAFFRNYIWTQLSEHHWWYFFISNERITFFRTPRKFLALMKNRWRCYGSWWLFQLRVPLERWWWLWTIWLWIVFGLAAMARYSPNAISVRLQSSPLAAAAAIIFLCFTNGLQKYLSFQIHFLAQPYMSKIVWGIRKKIWKNYTNNISRTYLALNQHW
jgi:hypothetical protein